jgi:ABC-2 type transport system permease protein
MTLAQSAIHARSRWAEGAGRTLRIVAESARLQILVLRVNPMVPLQTIAQPAVFLTVFLTEEGTVQPLRRTATVVAVLLSCLWGSTLWAAGGTLRHEVANGTLARNLTSTTDPRLVVGGKCLGSTAMVLGILLGVSAVTVLVTGISFRPSGAPLFVLGLVLVAASAAAMGFMLCSVFVLTRHALQVTAALMYPVYILSGLLIPTTFMPGPLAWVSRLISLYWADQFLDNAARGVFALRSMAFLILLTIVYFWAGCVLFSRVVHLAREKGTIALG